MQKDDLVYVGHMLDTVGEALELLKGRDRSEFDADKTLRLALAHLIQTLGEAARHVSAEYQTEHPEIPWRSIIGMRHKVVHDYLYVDYDTIWDVVTVDLPELITKLKDLAPPA
jgi:uncharacterized protein with HEPN domain